MTRDQCRSITLLPKDGPQQDPRILASKIATTNADIADDRAWFTAKGGETMELVSDSTRGTRFGQRGLRFLPTGVSVSGHVS